MYKNNLILSVNSFLNFFSISISDGFFFCYDELKNGYMKSENYLKIINHFLKKNKILINNIEILAFGEYFFNSTNLKLNFTITYGLSLIWKIPIIKINTLNAIILEAFYTYGNNDFFICFNNNLNKTYYTIVNKNNLFENNLNFTLSKFKDIILPSKKIISIFISCKKYTNTLKQKNPLLQIEKNINSKAIYIDLILRKKIINLDAQIVTKIKPNYIFN